MSERTKQFGQFFKSLRLARGFTLRRFCREKGFDASNMSKMERGLLVPPRATLERYARALGLKEGSDEWLTLFDLAALARGEIPRDLLSDEEVLEKLPLVFRTARGEKLTEAQKSALIELVRRS